jgi:hypothetical protein
VVLYRPKRRCLLTASYVRVPKNNSENVDGITTELLTYRILGFVTCSRVSSRCQRVPFDIISEIRADAFARADNVNILCEGRSG